MTSNVLRIGVILDSFVTPAWIAKIVTDLQSSDYASIETVLLTQAPPAQTYPFLFRVYERWDYRRNKLALDALELQDLTDALSHTPCITMQHVAGFSSEVVDQSARIHALHLDVILCLIQTTPSEIVNASRFGTMSFRFGGQQNGHDIQPPLFRQLLDRSPVAPSAIYLSSPNTLRISYHGQAATDPASLYRTRNPVFWKSAEAAVRALYQLQQSGAEYIQSLPLAPAIAVRHRSCRGTLNSVSMVRFYGQEVSRWIKARVASRRASEPPKWCICIRPLNTNHAFDNPAGYAIMPSPKDRFYADPFLFERDGRTFLFFEDFRYAEGRALISYCELGADGTPGAPVEVLRRPYHLSYPFLFEDGGEIYMIPETRANHAIELYRATNFPTEWTQETDLISPIAAVDATIQRIHGKLWMFTSVSNGAYSNSDELALFFADTLKGPWTPHQQNPVVSDVQRARPAGMLFSEGSRLIRPSQDCGKAYGYATVFSEIVTLTETEYEEHLVSRILPETIPHAISNHTYNRTQRFEVVDRTLPAHIANAPAS